MPLAGVLIDLDDPMLYTRLEIVKTRIKTITESSTLGSRDPALPTILKSVIAGEGLYEHNVGELFDLYGTFDQRHKTTGPGTKAKMVRQDERRSGRRHFKRSQFKVKGVYEQQSHRRAHYAVRNHLADPRDRHQLS